VPLTPTSLDETAPNPAGLAWWLKAAGLYNLLWGAVTIAAPEKSLRWLGVQVQGNQLWPDLWGCIGMIIGVYGIGYLIAARDVARHWPIVLVGLLGKIFGPIGFIDAAMHGRLPWSMGWTIITNDLLWWVPFSLMLLHARKVCLASESIRDGARTSA
jgi:small multidrug resistance pump